MASATRLNAISSILNNTGLNTNSNLVAEISAFQSRTPLQSLANAYTNAGINANVSSNVISLLDTVGTTTTKGYFLLDLYPPNVAPVASANLVSWAPNTNFPTGELISHNGRIFKTTGNTFSGSFNSTVIVNCDLKGFSEAVKLQAELPFKYNLNGFANVFNTVYGFVNLGFDNSSSASMLKSTSYADAGVGYTGPVDLVTNGIGTSASLLSNVISKFGTMYDSDNISKLGDPYVFGQNLLDQGLGYINNMEGQFVDLGLNADDITMPPQAKLSSTQIVGDQGFDTPYGTVAVPAVEETTTAVVSKGTSTEVVTKVYETVIGANLSAIISATNITVDTSKISNLKDFLSLDRVVYPDDYNALKSLGINNFTDLGNYLSTKTSPASFATWTAMAEFFGKIEIPSLNHLPTGGNTGVLLTSTQSTIANIYGSGSGSFENAVMNDFLGACAGNPYTEKFQILNLYYANTASTLGTLVKKLDTAVINYGVAYNTYEASYVDDGMGGGSYSLPPPSISAVNSNISAINSFLSNLPTTPEQQMCDTVQYEILDTLSQEITNLQLAGVVFDPATVEGKRGFSESFHMLASDKDQFESYQFFSNIITNDIPGDTIRAAIDEYINETVLASVGIVSHNDPDPATKILEAKTRNQPLTEYLSRNK